MQAVVFCMFTGYFICDFYARYSGRALREIWRMQAVVFCMFTGYCICDFYARYNGRAVREIWQSGWLLLQL